MYVLMETGEANEARHLLRDTLASDDPVLRAEGTLADVEVQQIHEGIAPDIRDKRREEARAVLEQAQDHVGLARYWRNVGFDAWAACQAGVALERWERGLAHAQAAGAVGVSTELLGRILICLVLGPTPAAEALARVDEAIGETEASPLLEADARMARGLLWSMEGRAHEGYELIVEGLRTVRESGQLINAAGMVQRLEFAERRRGGSDVEQRIERALRESLGELSRLEDRSYSPTVALNLAQCLQRQGRVEEARALCALARQRTLPEDIVNFIYLDAVEGKLAAMEGRLDEAVDLARGAVKRADTTDFVVLRGAGSREVLATILAKLGRTDDAARFASEAIELHHAKGDVTGIGLLRRQFEEAGIVVYPGPSSGAANVS
jgi:tetratricopeptide (TPR) repeat protein